MAAAYQLKRLNWTPTTTDEAVLLSVSRFNVDELVALGSDAVPPLLGLADDRTELPHTYTNASVQNVAVAALAKLNDPGAFDALSSVLLDARARSYAREAAVNGLLRIDSERAVPYLSQFLERGFGERDLQIKVAKALRGSSQPVAVDALTSLFHTVVRNPGDRWGNDYREIAESLVQVGNPKVVAPLLEMATWPDSAEVGVGALTRVLRKRPETLTIAHLRTIASLATLEQKYFPDPDQGATSMREVSTAGLKELASRELQRRESAPA